MLMDEPWTRTALRRERYPADCSARTANVLSLVPLLTTSAVFGTALGRDLTGKPDGRQSDWGETAGGWGFARSHDLYAPRPTRRAPGASTNTDDDLTLGAPNFSTRRAASVSFVQAGGLPRSVIPSSRPAGRGGSAPGEAVHRGRHAGSVRTERYGVRSAECGMPPCSGQAADILRST